MSYTVSSASCKPSKSLAFKQKTSVVKAQSAVFNTQTGIEKVSTIGGILVDEDNFKYGLGTCHGLKQRFVDNQNDFLGDRDHEIINIKNTVFFGRLKTVLFTDELDVALVRIDGRRKMDNAIVDNAAIGHPSKIYTPSVADEKKLKVVLLSDVQEGKTVEGIVIQAVTSAAIRFSINGQLEKTMNNLIAISTDSVNGKSLTLDGDSGAWVRTKDKNEVVGMVIGATKQATYVMPMENILKGLAAKRDIILTLLTNEKEEHDAI
jgi:hypothetical protein